MPDPDRERQWFEVTARGGLVIHAVHYRTWDDPPTGIMKHRRLSTRCGRWVSRTCGRIGDVNCMSCLVAAARSKRRP